MNSCQQEIKNIANWMREYLEKSGCGGYVCGISGGVDSALIASLCCKAIDKGNFIGIYLPCESSPIMETDALQLAENLGIELRVFNLIGSYNAIMKELEKGGETVSRLTKSNTKARLRMTYLFAIANQYNYLVCGTGNKSELDIGYCTVGGDNCVSIEPMGNYYKTEIYKIAELMPEIPKNILTKKPSADLYENQTDEEEIGMTYKQLDKNLQNYHRNYGTWFDFKDGATEEEFNKVVSMIEKAVYKNEIPPRYIRK